MFIEYTSINKYLKKFTNEVEKILESSITYHVHEKRLEQ